MKIPTVENFLFCLELRLGGLVCGWLGLIGSVLGAIGLVLALIFGRQYIGDYFSPVNTGNIANKDGSTIGIVISAIVGLIFFAAYFYCSWKLLKGTENVSTVVSILMSSLI